jgi:hypothetical protein
VGHNLVTSPKCPFLAGGTSRATFPIVPGRHLRRRPVAFARTPRRAVPCPRTMGESVPPGNGARGAGAEGNGKGQRRAGSFSEVRLTRGLVFADGISRWPYSTLFPRPRAKRRFSRALFKPVIRFGNKRRHLFIPFNDLQKICKKYAASLEETLSQRPSLAPTAPLLHRSQVLFT